jgi:clan AA aspartic protease (TIGR02281 family)
MGRVAQVNAEAQDCLKQRDFVRGLAAVDDVLNTVEVPELLETKVNLLNNAGRGNEAYLVLEHLLELRPDVGYLHFAAGAFALNLKPEASIPHYEAAARLEPANNVYQITLGNLYLQKGRADEAFAVFAKLVQQDPDCLDCWYNYGNRLFGVGQYDHAISVFRQAVEESPQIARHQFHLALCLDNVARSTSDKSKEKEAAEHYRKSLELQPMPNSIAADRYYQITGERVPAELEAKSASEIALEPSGKGFLVRASINGVEGRFVLDTGASYMSVYESAAKRFSLTPTARRAEVHTANGTIQLPVAYGNVQVGQQKLSSAAVFLLPDNKDRQADGLLGNDFLLRFDPDFDFRGHRLILRGYRGEE